MTTFWLKPFLRWREAISQAGGLKRQQEINTWALHFTILESWDVPDLSWPRAQLLWYVMPEVNASRTHPRLQRGLGKRLLRVWVMTRWLRFVWRWWNFKYNAASRRLVLIYTRRISAPKQDVLSWNQQSGAPALMCEAKILSRTIKDDSKYLNFCRGIIQKWFYICSVVTLCFIF